VSLPVRRCQPGHTGAARAAPAVFVKDVARRLTIAAAISDDDRGGRLGGLQAREEKWHISASQDIDG
jgi:hypothetical protein